MTNTRLLPLAAVPVLVLPLLAGCGGSGEDLAPVQGTVTLDGNPLPDALVEFELEPGENVYQRTSGSSSRGRTDADGRYTLKYTHDSEGALVGKHVVRITTRRMTVDAQGKEVSVPERLPPQFNLKSELTAEVKPGSNPIDFQLKLQAAPAAAE